MSASTIVKLQLLKYPKLEDFNYKMESVRQFKVVILFLEEEVIRALDVEERHKIKLVDDMYSEEYIEALTNYYSVLEAPAVLINLIPSACTNDDDPRNCSARLMLLEYALSQAIQYSYTDQKAFFNQSSNDVLLTNTTKIDNNSDASANRMDDTDGAANETLDEEVAILAKALGPLLQAFKMPAFPSPVTAADILASAREMNRRATYELAVFKYSLQAGGSGVVVTNIAASNGIVGDANNGNTIQTNKINPREILTSRKSAKTAPIIPNLSVEEAKTRLKEYQTLCIGTDDINNAIAVIKLVHTNELRQLQQSVNEIIALCQEFTANPVVDAKRGKVGR